jgi:hypothetical protein
METVLVHKSGQHKGTLESREGPSDVGATVTYDKCGVDPGPPRSGAKLKCTTMDRSVSDSVKGTHLPTMYQSKAQALPPEMTHEIFQYVDKDQLVAVALTCRSYQPEAERLLYERITMDDISKADRACLKTLATSLRKAVLVRSFHLDWSMVTTDVQTTRLRTLGNAVLGMKSLKFLYLHLHWLQVGPVQLVLNPILRCG